MNYNFSNLLDIRNLQEQVKKAFCQQKLFWPFTGRINCTSHLKQFANSQPSASNFKSFSRSLEQFFLAVGQNNFGNKIPFFSFFIQLTSLPFLETKFVPLAFSKYLKANVLRSERVVDTDELWYGNTVPSLACKYLHTWAEPPEYKQFRLGTNVYEVGIICPPLNEINFTKD